MTQQDETREGKKMTPDMKTIQELFTVEQLLSNIKQTREKIDWLRREILILQMVQGGGVWTIELIKTKKEAIADYEDVIENWKQLISIAPFSLPESLSDTHPSQ